MKNINNITNNFYSDEWYTKREIVELAFKLFPPNEGDHIICPFDSDKSNFVKVVKEKYDKNVLYGMRDFLVNDYDYDYLITNPPFSIKDEVIGKCVASGKPSVLILPLDVLGGVERHRLYRQTCISVYIPTRRISYIDGLAKKRDGVSFHSLIMQINAKQNSFKFEFEYKPKISRVPIRMSRLFEE